MSRPRRRLTATLFGGAALGTTGYIAALTVSTLAVEEITGSATFAGVPGAAAVLGTAAGASVLSARVADRGRRPGLVAGYALGVAGGAVATLAVALGSVLLLLSGMAVLGFGHASNQLARYTGAELFPVEQRASALSLIVWAGTIGSVLGPALLEPAGGLATALGRSELAGAYLVAAAFMGLALSLYLAALRPDPASLAVDRLLPEPERRRGDLSAAFARPAVRVALATLIAGQVVMVLIMTATPLHVRHAGFDLGIVGLVMSAHTLGMFAFSPLTGRLADRVGRVPTAVGGIALLGVSAVMAATAPATSTPLLVAALFLLGLGWNLGFVAGSALLTAGLDPALRARLQGRADTVTWTSSAVASLAAGGLLETTSYPTVAWIGLGLLAAPALVVARHRRRAALVTA